MKLLTGRQLADFLGVSDSRLSHWKKRGLKAQQLDAQRVLYNVDDVRQFFAERAESSVRGDWARFLKKIENKGIDGL